MIIVAVALVEQRAGGRARLLGCGRYWDWAGFLIGGAHGKHDLHGMFLSECVVLAQGSQLAPMLLLGLGILDHRFATMNCQANSVVHRHQDFRGIPTFDRKRRMRDRCISRIDGRTIEKDGFCPHHGDDCTVAR